MKKSLILIILVAISYYSSAQELSNKNKKSKIKFAYSYIVDGEDSIKCRRIPIEERQKMSTLEMAFLPQLEQYLDEYKECLNGNYLSNCEHKQIDQYILYAKNQNIETKDYETELNYYIQLQDKKIKNKKSQTERENKMRDSISSEKIKQEKLNDSIAKIKQKEYQKNGQAYRAESDYITRCLCSNSYEYVDPKKEKTVNNYAAVCFNNYIVAFYTKEVGEITFDVSQPSGVATNNEDGGWVFLYISEESKTTTHGYYTLQIYHTKDDKKMTAVFTFSGSSNGAAYIFSSDKFCVNSDLTKYFNK